MKKTYLSLLIAVVLVFSVVLPAFAATGQPPVGSCPSGFELHEFGHHEGEHPDHHIGLKVDLNGDGWICMKPLKNGLHVHMDNVIR